MTTVETYVERAKRLGLDPTEVCIACGSSTVDRQVLKGKNRFCDHHVDWETATAVVCNDCGYSIGLTCDEWTRR